MEADDRGFVEHWQRISGRLEEIRREELRNFRYEDHIAEIDALFDMAVRLGTPRRWSGLVEQQRLFQLAREQMSGE